MERRLIDVVRLCTTLKATPICSEECADVLLAAIGPVVRVLNERGPKHFVVWRPERALLPENTPLRDQYILGRPPCQLYLDLSFSEGVHTVVPALEHLITVNRREHGQGIKAEQFWRHPTAVSAKF